MQPSLSSVFSARIFTQAWRMTLRDWRAGELRFLFISLMVAVAAVSSVGFLVDRMNQALTRDASELLGADLVIRSDYPVKTRWRDHATELGLNIADTIGFPSMVTTGSGNQEDSRLAAIKAVSANYPLRGALKLDVQGRLQSMRGSPAAGTVWVDAAFLTSRDMQQGQRIKLGEQEFIIAAAILLEQDRGAAFMNFAPRVMLSEKDLAATGLIQNGSRVSYRLQLSGNALALSRYQRWLENQIKEEEVRGVQIESLETGRPEMRATLDRARQFLALVSLLSAMLAALAIAMAARRFLERHLDACAMLRCLGLTQNQLTLIYLIEFSLIGLIGSLAGAALGFAAHFILLQWLGPLMATALPAAGWTPLLQAIATGLLLLLGFAIPPVMQLRNVPHNRVIRREQDAPQAFTLAGYALAIVSFVALLIWQAGDIKLGLITAGGFIAAFALFALLAWLLLKSLHLLRPLFNSPIWRFALTSLKRRPGASIMQIVALALGLMALLLLTVIRQDLLSAWRQSSPPNAPNHFMINIQPEQKDGITQELAANHITDAKLYPMIRGRLVQIAGSDITPESFADERARRLVEREFNLSTMAELPAKNIITDGQWFKVGSNKPEASVEQGLAKTLGIKPGDTLRFDVAGEQIDATVTSLRKLDWGSMRVNFFVILNPPAATALPQTWITAFRLPPAQQKLINQLVRTYPNLTIVDVGSMLNQVQQVINQVIAAVEFLFVFTLVAGILVLISAMLVSQQERQREAGLLRALGATRTQLARSQWMECALVGASAGAMAASGAAIAGWILARYVFDFVWTLSPLLWVAGMSLGIIAALAGGWAGLRSVLTQAPLQTLREA
jgi:putative ABC transport system permease protein